MDFLSFSLLKNPYRAIAMCTGEAEVYLGYFLKSKTSRRRVKKIFTMGNSKSHKRFNSIPKIALLILGVCVNGLAVINIVRKKGSVGS